MKIRAVTTDKYGFKREIGATEIFEEIYGAQRVEASDKPVTESFLGFGIALTGSSCSLLQKMDAAARAEVLSKAFGEKGLNLSLARISVGSSDYSPELYCCEDAEGNFTIDKDKEYVLPVLREALKTNENLKFFCAPWSPPGRMKTGGSMCGGFMREGFLEEYAAYYCDFLAAYRREGIDIFALTAQNEPETDQTGKMPACLFSPELEAKFIFLMRKNLRERGLNPEIWLCDHNFIYVKRVLWQLKEYPELLSAVNGAAFHYYAGGAEQTEAIRADYPQLGLHFTEGGPGLHNNYAADYCKWGATVCRALNHGFRSFTGWNLLLDESGAPNIGPYFCGGLITVDSVTGELSYSGQYRAFSHFAPVVTRGASVYPCKVYDSAVTGTASYQAAPIACDATAVKDKNGVFSLFFVNPAQEKKQIMLKHGKKTVYFEALPDSLTTLQIE